MDVSKLPRLSKTDSPGNPPAEGTAANQHMPPPAQPVSERVVYVEHAAPGGPEAWISMAMGVLFLLMTPYSVLYFSSKMFGTTFAPFPDPTRPYPAKCDFIQYTDGTRIYYQDMPQFWSDAVLTLFALTLIIDGIVIAARVRNRKIVIASFGLTIVVVGLNLFYLLKTLGNGLAIMSALAVAYGVYIAIFQWRLLQMLKQRELAQVDR